MKCALSISGNQQKTFAITDTRVYVPLVTSSTQDNIQILKEQLTGTNINQR